jgi:hypothetical protein
MDDNEILTEIREFAAKLAVREDVREALDSRSPVWKLGIWEMVRAFEEGLRSSPLPGQVRIYDITPVPGAQVYEITTKQ